MGDRGNLVPPDETEVCFICGQPAGGGEMKDGAHVLCSWGLTDHQRRQKLIVKRRGLFISLEALQAEESE
jgi:hypothetical protein